MDKQKKSAESNRYNGLNVLKIILCISIVLMHISANTHYEIDGYFYNNVIILFARFTLLFMMISAFGMCCGYYEKIKNNKISPKEFYSKRVKRILPFFALVTIIEVFSNRDLITVLNSLFNITLTRGLIPNYINNVIGVGWFIGTVFLFYIIFPYFVYLLDNKKKAWITFVVSIVLNLTLTYLIPGIGSSYLLYSFPYFTLGGIIFLYKDSITSFLEKRSWLRLLMIIIVTTLFLLIPSNQYFIGQYLVLFATYMVCAISSNGKVSNSKILQIIGKYTMQIYLCHMIIFRIIEKTNIINLTHKDLFDYILVSILTLTGSYLFSFVMEKGIEKIQSIISKRINKK